MGSNAKVRKTGTGIVVSDASYFNGSNIFLLLLICFVIFKGIRIRNEPKQGIRSTRTMAEHEGILGSSPGMKRKRGPRHKAGKQSRMSHDAQDNFKKQRQG